MNRGPDADEKLLREAAEKADRLAEQLLRDASDLRAGGPSEAEAAAGVQEAAESARRLAEALRRDERISPEPRGT